MQFTHETANTEMHSAIPSFKSEWERDRLSIRSSTILGASFVQKLKSYSMSDRLKKRINRATFPACMQVRERLLRDGDSDVRDLVSETVETVSSCAREQDIKKWAGPEVLAVWSKQRTQFAGNRVGYLTISSGPEMRLARFLSLLRLYLPSLALGWKSHATGEKRTRNPHSVLGVV